MLESVWRKEKPLGLLVGTKLITTSMENSVESAQRTRNKAATWPSDPTTGHKSWGSHNWKRHVYPNRFWTVVLEKTLESPLDCEEIQPVHPEGDQSWVYIGRTDAEAETPILWPTHAKSWLIGIHPDAGKDWRQEEKGTTEDEMAGWHHRLDGHEFE